MNELRMIIYFDKSGVYKYNDQFSLILSDLIGDKKQLYLCYNGIFGVSSTIKIETITDDYVFNKDPLKILNDNPKKSNVLKLRINNIQNYRCEVLSITTKGIHIEEILGNITDVKCFKKITDLEKYLNLRNELNKRYPIYLLKNETLEKKDYAIRQKQIIDEFLDELIYKHEYYEHLKKYLYDVKSYKITFLINDRFINIKFPESDDLKPTIEDELPNIIDDPSFYKALGKICEYTLSIDFIKRFKHISLLLDNLTMFVIEYNIQSVETEDILINKFSDIIDNIKPNSKMLFDEFDDWKRYIITDNWDNAYKIIIKIQAENKTKKEKIVETEIKLSLKTFDKDIVNYFKYLNIKN